MRCIYVCSYYPEIHFGRKRHDTQAYGIKLEVEYRKFCLHRDTHCIVFLKFMDNNTGVLIVTLKKDVTYIWVFGIIV